jgi:hypothetical protein
MPGKKGTKVTYFPKVKEAREALRGRAIEILESYIAVIAEARAAGDFETATKSLQWLIEHMPEEDGGRMVDISVDKPKQIEASKGPSIQIGIALGGTSNQKTLPAAIDITPEELINE